MTPAIGEDAEEMIAANILMQLYRDDANLAAENQRIQRQGRNTFCDSWSRVPNQTHSRPRESTEQTNRDESETIAGDDSDATIGVDSQATISAGEEGSPRSNIVSVRRMARKRSSHDPNHLGMIRQREVGNRSRNGPIQFGSSDRTTTVRHVERLIHGSNHGGRMNGAAVGPSGHSASTGARPSRSNSRPSHVDTAGVLPTVRGSELIRRNNREEMMALVDDIEDEYEDIENINETNGSAEGQDVDNAYQDKW